MSDNQDLISELVALLDHRFGQNGLAAVAFPIECEFTRIAVVVAADDDNVAESEWLLDTANKAMEAIHTRYGCQCAFGIGEVVSDIGNNAKYSYRQAETVLKYLFYTGYPAVLLYAKVIEKKIVSIDIAIKDMLIAAVREYDMEKICKIIDHIYNIATTGGYIRPQHFIYTLNMWILDIAEFYRHAIKPDDFNQLHQQLNNRFPEERTAAKYTEHLILTLSDIIVCIKGSLEHKHDEIIKDCLEFLKHNFNKDISLQEAAAHCYLSTSYFSALFKMHTGTTFNQYMVDLRMQRAKQLLGIPDMKIYEIADTLGYSDTKYFHRIFKKYYKMTPQEYKSKLRKTGQV